MAEKICPKCNNKRHIFVAGRGWVRCECLGRIRADRLMVKSGFPDSLWEIDIKTLKAKIGENENGKELLKSISTSIKKNDKKNMFIYSKTTNKEIAAAVLCRYTLAVHEDVKTVAYMTLDQLVQSQFGKEYGENIVTDPIFADITVISLGCEMTNNAHRNELFKLLYERILTGRQTVILSFIPAFRIKQIYHKAVAELVESHFNFYTCEVEKEGN